MKKNYLLIQLYFLNIEIKVNEASCDYSQDLSSVTKDFVVKDSKFSIVIMKKTKQEMIAQNFHILSNWTQRKSIYFIEYNNTNQQKSKNSLIVCFCICLNSTFTS